MPWIALNLHLYCSHVFTLIVHYRSIKISKFSKGVSLHSHFTLDLGNIYFCCSNILFFVKSLLETVAKLSSLLGTATAAAAAKSLQSFPTLCDPIDGSPPGSPIPGILQARTLEWVAISFSNAWKWKVKSESEVAQSCPTLSDPHGLQPTRLLHPWDFLAKSTGVGCHCLLQGMTLVGEKNSQI